MIVLDTNVVSELTKLAPDPVVRDWLHRTGATDFVLTAVTVAEIEFGLQRLPDGKRKQELTANFEAFVETMPILPLDDVAARQAGRFRALRAASGRPASALDMMIAGIVGVAGAALATRNVRDFRGLPIPIENPWQVV